MSEGLTIEGALKLLVENIKRELDRSDAATTQAFKQQNDEIKMLKRSLNDRCDTMYGVMQKLEKRVLSQIDTQNKLIADIHTDLFPPGFFAANKELQAADPPEIAQGHQVGSWPGEPGYDHTKRYVYQQPRQEGKALAMAMAEISTIVLGSPCNSPSPEAVIYHVKLLKEAAKEALKFKALWLTFRSELVDVDRPMISDSYANKLERKHGIEPSPGTEINPG